jgi:hypothetical protein
VSEDWIKRGDSFEMAAVIGAVINDVQVSDLTGYSIVSKIRDPKGQLIANLSFQWVDASNGIARIFYSGSTSAWPLTFANMDIRLVTPDGKKVTSETISFEIRESPSDD